jgi:hypothetical protein
VRVIRLALALVAATMSAACLVVSLHPVYDPETIAFDPALVGTWLSDEDGVTLTIDRGEWHSYHLTLLDHDKPTRLSARQTRVGSLQLLDVTPLDGSDTLPLQLPVHGIYRFEIEADTLTLATLDYDRLYTMATNGTGPAGVVVDDRKNVVFTGSTPEVRRWLLEHAGDEGLFAAPVTMKRKAAAAQ